MPGRRTPRQACDGLSFRSYQILHVFTHRLLISQIVILLQQAVDCLGADKARIRFASSVVATAFSSRRNLPPCTDSISTLQFVTAPDTGVSSSRNAGCGAAPFFGLAGPDSQLAFSACVVQPQGPRGRIHSVALGQLRRGCPQSLRQSRSRFLRAPKLIKTSSQLLHIVRSSTRLLNHRARPPRLSRRYQEILRRVMQLCRKLTVHWRARIKVPSSLDASEKCLATSQTVFIVLRRANLARTLMCRAD